MSMMSTIEMDNEPSLQPQDQTPCPKEATASTMRKCFQTEAVLVKKPISICQSKCKRTNTVEQMDMLKTGIALRTELGRSHGEVPCPLEDNREPMSERA